MSYSFFLGFSFFLVNRINISALSCQICAEKVPVSPRALLNSYLVPGLASGPSADLMGPTFPPLTTAWDRPLQAPRLCHLRLMVSTRELSVWHSLGRRRPRLHLCGKPTECLASHARWKTGFTAKCTRPLVRAQAGYCGSPGTGLSPGHTLECAMCIGDGWAEQGEADSRGAQGTLGRKGDGQCLAGLALPPGPSSPAEDTQGRRSLRHRFQGVGPGQGRGSDGRPLLPPPSVTVTILVRFLHFPP